MGDGKCPHCHEADPIAAEDQPVAGTHAFTVIYECGSKIDYIIGQYDWLSTKSCLNKKEG